MFSAEDKIRVVAESAGARPSWGPAEHATPTPPASGGRHGLENYADDEIFCNDLPSIPQPQIGDILVTGASGYIGGRLVPELLARGYRVKAMVRAESPDLQARWPSARIVVADALKPQSLRQALQNVHTAYYLIHSLLLGPRQFSAADLDAAVNFQTAASEAGVARIIYLGGLGDTRSQLSDHLRSRARVAEALAGGPAAVTVLRAAIIIGSGSASYEIIEHLVRNLPVLPVPAWARNNCQPIAIRDVVKYLVGVLETPQTAGGQFDLGGQEILTYEEMLRVMAKVLGKRRLFVPLPSLHIGLFAYVSSLITPVPGPITRCLMQGLANEVVCTDNRIRELIPFQLSTYRQSIVRALTRQDQDRVRTRWSDAYPPAHELALKLRELTRLPRYTVSYSLHTAKNAATLFQSVCRIGGRRGWFHNNWMWRLRGAADRLLLGVGSARGRKRYSALEINDVVDFWRVEDFQPDCRVLLRAEMKLPGKAWLEFTIRPQSGGNELSVTSYYDTASFFGRVYWYLFLPFHHFIFANLIKQIEKRSAGCW